MGDIADVSNLFSMQSIKTAERSSKGAWAFLCWVLLFILTTLLTFRIKQPNEIRQAVLNPLLQISFNEDGRTLMDISTLDDLKNFFNVHLMQGLFNNSVQMYGFEYKDNEHYVAEFNYLMGLRITTNRVDLIPNTDRGYEEAIPDYRKTNYDNEADETFKKISTEPYGPSGVQYSSNGGYDGKGGYVFFFNDTLTIDEVLEK